MGATTRDAVVDEPIDMVDTPERREAVECVGEGGSAGILRIFVRQNHRRPEVKASGFFDRL